MFKKILVGYDGSQGSKLALSCAAELAEKFESDVTALFVRGPLPRHSDLPGEFEAEFEAADEIILERQLDVLEIAAKHGLSIRCEARSGHPAKAIVKHAAEGSHDLIIVGHSSHSELWGRLFGDTADSISDHAHCTVLIMKAGAEIFSTPLQR